MKQYKRIISLTMSILMITLCFCETAMASEAKLPTDSGIISPLSYITEQTSTTYTEIIPAWNGEYGSYNSLSIQVTVTSNITFSYATGRITGFSTPSISMTCYTDGRLVSTIAGAPSCSISSNGYNLLVTHQSAAYIGYLYYSVGDVNAYEYTYHLLPSRTVTLSPQ